LQACLFIKQEYKDGDLTEEIIDKYLALSLESKDTRTSKNKKDISLDSNSFGDTKGEKSKKKVETKIKKTKKESDDYEEEEKELEDEEIEEAFEDDEEVDMIEESADRTASKNRQSRLGSHQLIRRKLLDSQDFS